ncbi:hypothetical protein Tco_0728408 [Tanacetum coccineum]|uniref:Uncharacterized protein n=1 Tax=Tanacetum coccineum TaxID=301880 RepID=A0ABQ4YLW4_9ASTR
MKMRQYIAITDHILWDIITNGDQATTDPASSSAPKTSLAANARRNNEKALNILLSAIPDRHLLSFHDATDAKTLWSAIKARFRGNEASKKMQKNLLNTIRTCEFEVSKKFTIYKTYAPSCSTTSMPTTHDDERPAANDDDARKKLTFDGSAIAKYQENRANGRNEKKIVAIEDSNSKALVATNNNEEVDWTKEFDDEPVTFAMMALTELEEESDDTPVSLALMATNSENKYAWGDKYEQMEYDLKMRDLKLKEKQKELDQVLKERDDFKNYLVIKLQKVKGFHAVPPPTDKTSCPDFKEFKGGYVAFGNDPKGGRITRKGTIKTSCIDFEKVSYVEELKFNLLSVSQICDKKHNENQKGKGPDWMFDLELLTPSMNYIPVRKENYADSGGQETTYNDVEDLDTHNSEECTADKEVPLSSEEQALHDELVSLMHQESIAKVHNERPKGSFEKRKERIALEKDKDSVNSTFTLSTANTPSQSTGNTPTDSDDDVPKEW